MIAVDLVDGRRVTRASLPAGATAYIDADWIPAAHSGDVPALVVTDGWAWFGEGSPVDVPGGTDPDGFAADALLAVAERAAEAVAELPPTSVEVVGHGLVAETLRELLGLHGDPPERPGAIVELTGDPVTIEEATRRLADLGRLVLAGEPLGRELMIDLYRDIHLRGLRLLAVPRPLQEHSRSAAGQAAAGVPKAWSLRAGDPVPPAPWYRIQP